MDFLCVGFDVRQWPWEGTLGADVTTWHENERRRAELVEKFCLFENEYQLLEVGAENIKLAIAEISSLEDCKFIAVEYQSELVKLRDSRLGFSTASNAIELNEFVCRGLDVCDLNGLFSVLHHPSVVGLRGGAQLFDTGDLKSALELVQFANILDPNHTPFAVARILTLK